MRYSSSTRSNADPTGCEAAHRWHGGLVIFTEGAGHAVIFAPTELPIARLGRVGPHTFERLELAVITHHGAHTDIDRQLAELGAHVAGHEISRPGFIRETYLEGVPHVTDAADWVAEVGWPVSHTHR